MTIDIDDLLDRLFQATYKTEGAIDKWRTFELDIISEGNREKIENIVREWYNDQLSEHDATIKGLEAKVRVYEEIIAKSNFAPFLFKDTNGDSEEN